jgi:broad specificity phosphatase PhoE
MPLSRWKVARLLLQKEHIDILESEAGMRSLILVRHSLPEIVPTVPGRLWQLSAEGRARCQLLAERLSVYQPTAIVASTEPKATETAALLATHLQVPYTTGEGLHEHGRETVPYLGQEAWQQTMTSFFARPDELVFGNESATQALQRFSAAVQQVVHQYDEGNIMIVTHGTVMTLFVAQHTHIQPFTFWRSLDTPAFVVLSLPAYSFVSIVTRLEMPSR